MAAQCSSRRMEEKPCSSSAADSSVDVAEEAKKLIGKGNRHLVMGDVVSAVSVFQEACAMLAERYGDTADECAEAFFLCGKSLLELARMENTVLGNALEGVPEESSEESEKQNDSKIESADNLDEETRDELRAQVYDAMSADKRDSQGEGQEVKEEGSGEEHAEKKEADASDRNEDKPESTHEGGEKTTMSPHKDEKPGSTHEDGEKTTMSPHKNDEKPGSTPEDGEKTMMSPHKNDEKPESTPEDGEKTMMSPHKNDEKPESTLEGDEKTTVSPNKNDEKPAESPLKSHEQASEHEVAIKNVEEGAIASKLEDAIGSGSMNEGVKEMEGSDEERAEPMEEECGDDDGNEDDDDNDDDDDDYEGEGNAEEKENEEEEVGNLQLAWEMLEVAKVIYKRKESKEDQLMAAQILLKLGEVGAESGNYTQALEDFQECLVIQLEHLPPHSRLLAETHYQLGMTFSYTAQYNQAIQHFTSSIKVIESRLAMLQEAIDKAEGAEEAKEERSELEELKQLLPEIAERVEDAKESQRTAAVASQAIHQTLGGASTSSAFPAENGGASSSTVSQIEGKPADGASCSKSTSDISHLVRKKVRLHPRKPEDESPKKDSDAKKVKQETTVNGSGDSASSNNGVQEKMEQEPANSSSSVETSA
ncbi:nuclear autoantigenic sperm protein isoform X4 [Brachyhypopomus gauderio]|uniref:nuclear autoantigenic sperm protein isoform X4 n=1 Tax=Brachyhypopomus gauderio TaxID=698409 RepID=UPI0040411CB0